MCVGFKNKMCQCIQSLRKCSDVFEFEICVQMLGMCVQALEIKCVIAFRAWRSFGVSRFI